MHNTLPAILIAGALIFGGFCAWLAGTKGREPATWFFLGTLFWIISLLALVGAPVVEAQEKPVAAKSCTDPDAWKCSHCGFRNPRASDRCGCGNWRKD